MKVVALYLILCSAVGNQCLEPHRFNTYDSHYDCMIAGNTESINKIESMGAEVINNSKIYIKFICAEEEAEKINL
tara:strand:- start:12084 stop:12308 length:225 start_codon:yes stop_codon:yes gene_type:complete